MIVRYGMRYDTCRLGLDRSQGLLRPLLPSTQNNQKWNLIHHHRPCSSPQPSFLKEQKPQVYSDLSIGKE